MKYISKTVLLITMVLLIFAGTVQAQTIVINEVDADTPGTDALEFVELYDGGGGNTTLDGLVVVFYNGNGDISYNAFDLDGYTTDANGYFLLGNSGVNPTPAITFPNNGLQNGADAVAIYAGDDTDFPNGTALTTANLIDAIVYDTNDDDDAELLLLLNTGQPQVNEGGNGDKDNHSNQRCPNGSGGPRNTNTYAQFVPTPGGENICIILDDPPTVSSTIPASGAINVAIDANIQVAFSEDVTVTGDWFNINCTSSGVHTATTSVSLQNYTLDPDPDFVNSETCTVTIVAAQIADKDTDDPPDTMIEDYQFSFDTANPSVVTTLVINEIDYDQPGSDTAEFIEIKNTSDSSVNLSAYRLDLVNGNGGTVYQSIALPDVNLDAGDYYVVCNDDTTVNNCDLEAVNSIQNGAPDAVALKLGETIVDTVSYAGDTIGYTEGSGSGLIDDTSVDRAGISRFPDGTDTNYNNLDLSLRCITPGEANTEANSNCAPPFGACGDPATFIHKIQGSGMSSPEDGKIHVIEGVVVGDFQTSAHLRGFFVQEEDNDADTGPGSELTSEGIFVYDGSSPAIDVNVGDVVRVEGQVIEYNDLTELTSISSVEICPQGGVATATTVTLPVASVNEWEWYEGMLINIPQMLYATDNYYQGRYGEVELSVGDRLDQPTNVVEPGAPAIALQDFNDRSRIQLEDGRTSSNPVPVPYIGDGGTLRVGDTIPGLTGVLNYAYSTYEVHPTGAVNFTRVNTRDATPPDVGGTLKVASFNVLNYFSTIDPDPSDDSSSTPDNPADNICGPAANMECRGADSFEEFTRQRDKIISAIVTMDADVIGLMEMENHPTDAALQDLLDGLNDVAGPGTYAYVNTGPVGTDAIKVAFIYKPGVVTPDGAYAILDSSVDPTFNDQRNRPALAQTFQENASGEKFTAVVNHLKSKGSACDDIGDPDMGDGQGNCNQTRTAAAIAQVNWLATDPTGSGDPDFLIIGDLNSYAKEDPIDAIKAGSYTNLVEAFIGPDAYSYVFEGQTGYLDHALATSTLTAQVTGVTEWHINTDEPAVLDYNDYNLPAGLYNPDQYRASDHDPVLIGFDLRRIKDIVGTDRIGDTPIFDVFAGDIFTYTLDLKNPFEQAMYFVISDTLDAALEYRSGPFTETPNGLEYTSELLGIDGALSLSFDVQVQDVPVGTIIDNTAWITVLDIFGSTLAVFEAIAPSAHVIPEPATLLLVGAGVVGILAFARRRRRQKK